MPTPRRGEIWWTRLDPTEGHEQADTRPALVVSADAYNHGPLGLVIGLPMTRRIRPFPRHLPAQPEETGLRTAGAIMCDQPRVIATSRLVNARPAGRLAPALPREVKQLLRTVMELP